MERKGRRCLYMQDPGQGRAGLEGLRPLTCHLHGDPKVARIKLPPPQEGQMWHDVWKKSRSHLILLISS